MSNKPTHLPFDAQKAAVQKYPITSYQPVYFVAESFSDATEKVRYERYLGLPKKFLHGRTNLGWFARKKEPGLVCTEERTCVEPELVCKCPHPFSDLVLSVILSPSPSRPALIHPCPARYSFAWFVDHSEFANRMSRPFTVRYNPYTEMVEVLNKKETILRFASSIRADMTVQWRPASGAHLAPF